MVLGEGENFFSREKAETSASVYFCFLPVHRSLVRRRILFSKKAGYLLRENLFGIGVSLLVKGMRQTYSCSSEQFFCPGLYLFKGHIRRNCGADFIKGVEVFTQNFS